MNIMAKAKKEAESKEPAAKSTAAEAKPVAKSPAEEAKPAAKQAPGKKAAAPAAAKGKTAKPAAPQGMPMIDTGLAAQTAARLIGAKAAVAQPAGGAKKETSAFKQLKDSINKGHSSSVHSVLSNSMSPEAKKSSLPYRDGKQTGHNQTFGSDASKAFVPRRTGG